MAVLLLLACWYLSHQSACYDRLGYNTGWGVVHLCWTCLETCLELPKSRYLISLYSDLMDQFEGSRRFDDHQWNSGAIRDYIKITLKLYRSLCLHERDSWQFWLSDLCTQWLMTADVLKCSPTLRLPQFNDGTLWHKQDLTLFKCQFLSRVKLVFFYSVLVLDWLLEQY